MARFSAHVTDVVGDRFRAVRLARGSRRLGRQTLVLLELRLEFVLAVDLGLDERFELGDLGDAKSAPPPRNLATQRRTSWLSALISRSERFSASLSLVLSSSTSRWRGTALRSCADSRPSLTAGLGAFDPEDISVIKLQERESTTERKAREGSNGLVDGGFERSLSVPATKSQRQSGREE